MKKLFRLSNLRSVSALVAITLAIPVSWNWLTGFYSWLSPFIMLNSVFVLKSFVWLNFVSVGVIIISAFTKRWFCRNLCPVGYGCDLVSGLSSRNSLIHKRIPEINRWLAVVSLLAAIAGLPLFIFIDPMAIFNGFFTFFSGKLSLAEIISFSVLPLLLIIHLFFPSIWCTKLCPLGGLQMVIFDLKNKVNRIFTEKIPEQTEVNPGRRYFLMSGAGLLAGTLLPEFMKPSVDTYIRPPASVEPLLFNSLCCRCGGCTKVCPTGIIRPQTDFNNILGWMTPEIYFKSGYCLETCNLCSQVCPSGSITHFSIEAKGQLFMGTAEVKLENCLLVNNKECVRCKESCKYEAIEFVSQDSLLNVIPLVKSQKCVGCGACEVVCPAGCIEVKPLNT